MNRLPRKLTITKWVGLAACALVAATWALSIFVTVRWVPGEPWLAADGTWRPNDGMVVYTLQSGALERYNISGIMQRVGWKVERNRDHRLYWYAYWWYWRSSLIPLWIPFALLAAPTILAWCLDRRRFPAGACRRCGYNLRGNVSGVCPECGTSVSASTQRKRMPWLDISLARRGPGTARATILQALFIIVWHSTVFLTALAAIAWTATSSNLSYLCLSETLLRTVELGTHPYSVLAAALILVIEGVFGWLVFPWRSLRLRHSFALFVRNWWRICLWSTVPLPVGAIWVAQRTENVFTAPTLPLTWLVVWLAAAILGPTLFVTIARIRQSAALRASWRDERPEHDAGGRATKTPRATTIACVLAAAILCSVPRDEGRLLGWPCMWFNTAPIIYSMRWSESSQQQRQECVDKLWQTREIGPNWAIVKYKPTWLWCRTPNGTILTFSPVGLVINIAAAWVLVRAGPSFMRSLRRRLRIQSTDATCVVCGFNLSSNVSGQCPECGARAPAP